MIAFFPNYNPLPLTCFYLYSVKVQKALTIWHVIPTPPPISFALEECGVSLWVDRLKAYKFLQKPLLIPLQKKRKKKASNTRIERWLASLSFLTACSKISLYWSLNIRWVIHWIIFYIHVFTISNWKHLSGFKTITCCCLEQIRKFITVQMKCTYWYLKCIINKTHWCCVFLVYQYLMPLLVGTCWFSILTLKEWSISYIYEFTRKNMAKKMSDTCGCKLLIKRVSTPLP